MSKTVNLELLQRRVQVLQQMVALLTVCCVGLAAFLWLFESRGNVRAAASESLRVKRLAVVDDKGTERIVIAAPLPDPVVQGERFKRNGAISGIAIYDPDGNERGEDGGTLFLFNGKHDGAVLTTHSQPTMEMVQNRKIIFKNPSDAPDVRD